MRFVFFCLLLSAPVSVLFAQDLVIEFDALADTWTFKRGTTVVPEPRLRTGQTVLLRVVNFNNYRFSATATANGRLESPVKGQPDLGIGSPPPPVADEGLRGLYLRKPAAGSSSLSGLSGFFGNQSLASLLPAAFLKFQNTGFPGNGFFEKKGASKKTGAHSLDDQKRQEAFRELEAFSKKHQALSEKLKAAEADLHAAEEKLLAHKNTLILAELAPAQLEQVRSNPYLTTAQRKEIARDFLLRLFQSKGKQPALEDALSFAASFPTRLSRDRSQFQSAAHGYGEQLAQLQSLAEEVEASPIAGVKEWLTLQTALAESLAHSRDLLQSLENQSAPILPEETDPSVDSSSFTHSPIHSFTHSGFPQQVTDLFWACSEVLANPFEKTFSATAEGDFLDFDLRIFEKDSTGQPAEAPVKERRFSLPIRGGLKVNTSVGVGVAQFFRPVESYFVREDAIEAEQGDRFTPVLNTFVHFYNQRPGNCLVGGCIGAGFPVTGENKSLHFFLGGSLLFGRAERIVISSGLMGGQAQRLDKGLQAGDFYDGDTPPTRSRYELGYFLSASFNL